MFSVLGPEETFLLRQLDGIFESWGLAMGAKSMTMPPLLPVQDLARLGYFADFPHQAMVASALDLDALKDRPLDAACSEIYGDSLEPAALGLPSAACYAIYLHLSGQDLPGAGTLITVLAPCFRKEVKYERLKRLQGFYMREIVALGSDRFTAEHLERFSTKIFALAEALDITLFKRVATDPFYDRRGPRALTQGLCRLKHEFLFQDLAIASVNAHRNFFGERCDIKIKETSKPIFTSCVGFGLERWLSALFTRYGDWSKPIDVIEQFRGGVNLDACIKPASTVA